MCIRDRVENPAIQIFTDTFEPARLFGSKFIIALLASIEKLPVTFCPAHFAIKPRFECAPSIAHAWAFALACALVFEGAIAPSATNI